MEWVETTGRTVEEALDAALDELGVDEDEVEFEVLEAARGGLLARREARIRARVRPLSREKPGEQRRRRARRGAPTRPERTAARPDGGAVAVDDRPAGDAGRSGGPSRRRRRSRGGRGARAEATGAAMTEDGVSEPSVSVEEQAEVAEGFARGLVEAFGADADVVARIDEDAVLVDITGGDLGLLVGPRGVTLQAIEDLVRTVVQRQTEGHGTRINVDVGGYRAKRREALAAFAHELADQVRESGREQALEPMSAADRKVVHDTVAELDGVGTASEGEEPRRRVVIRPA
ncbi:MAG TPA: RNA-binding cell elongation regulator Jag/EloR [Actinomycetota bacterium]|nr:RNA-binding cell elongation regulator Jag/EloR [Actinomycetota bacterium]